MNKSTLRAIQKVRDLVKVEWVDEKVTRRDTGGKGRSQKK